MKFGKVDDPSLIDFTLPVEEVDVHHEITDEDHHNTHINGVKGPHEL